MPTFDVFCPACGGHNIKVRFGGTAYCNVCGAAIPPSEQGKTGAKKTKPVVATPVQIDAMPLARVSPGDVVAVSNLVEGAVFEFDGQRYIKVAPVHKTKVTAQRLNKNKTCGGTWIRGSAVSLDLDTIVTAR